MTKKLEAEIQRLQDRIDQLEMLLGIDDPTLTFLKSIVKLPPQPTKLLGHLFRHPGIHSRERLYMILHGGRPECEHPDSNHGIYVLIWNIRKSLKRHGIFIHTFSTEGWAIDEVNRAKIQGLIDAKLATYGYHKEDKG